MKTLQEMVEAGAIFYVSHSGGKDSQAMYNYLIQILPPEQICVVHSDLGEMEHDGVKDHIRETINHPLNVVKAGKTFFEMVEHRQMFPAPAYRQCTSDLKRGPIQKFTRNDMKLKGKLLGVNCMGLRAQESSARAKKKTWVLNKALSRAGREVYDWLPIHCWSETEVFNLISKSGQNPHPAYAQGYERLSCKVCIMASVNDLKKCFEIYPKFWKMITSIEKRINFTVFHGQTLNEKIGVAE